MWVVFNETLFKTDRSIVLDKTGRPSWVVVVKATFDITPEGMTVVAAEQVEPLLLPAFRGDPTTTSPLYEADLVFDKRNTDVLVNGSAHAPHGRPATSVVVGLKVGPIEKALRVRGERVYQASAVGTVVPSASVPFAAIPIIYERAYGGADVGGPDVSKHRVFAANPVGRGVAIRPESLVNKPAPNIEFSDVLMRDGQAAGFGPIGSHWEPRAKFSGTFDEAWKKDQRPLLPLDFDERFFQCAPLDQQASPDALNSAMVRLSNLSPSGILEFRLPRRRFSFVTEFDPSSKKRPVIHEPRLHTVVIEPEVPRVILTWHSRLDCGNAVEAINHTVVLDETDARS